MKEPKPLPRGVRFFPVPVEMVQTSPPGAPLAVEMRPVPPRHPMLGSLDHLTFNRGKK